VIAANRETESLLGRQRRSHHAFAADKRRVYVEPLSAFAELDTFAGESNSSPLMAIIGESGTGKSALVANWAHRIRRERGDVFVIEHYVGAESPGSSHVDALRRIQGEIRAEFNIEAPCSSADEDVEATFVDWLARTSPRKTVIIVDGVDQFDGFSQRVPWAPAYLPPNVRLIATATNLELLPPSFLDGVIVEMQGLTRAFRTEIARRFLAERGIEMSRSHVSWIDENSSTSNPLFIQLTVGEIERKRGQAADGERIDVYLNANGIDELLERILDRWEASVGSRMIARFFALLSTSRFGLSAADIQSLLHLDPPGADNLIQLVGHHLHQARGVYTHMHERLRTMAIRRYRPESDRPVLHRELAEYFGRHVDATRRAEEEPWHWQQSGECTELSRTLCDPKVVSALSGDQSQVELLKYWRTISDELDPAEQYSAVLQSRADLTAIELEHVGDLLTRLGRFAVADICYERALRLREREGANQEEIARSLHRAATLQYHMGNFEYAEDRLRKALQALEAAELTSGALRGHVLNDLGVLLYQRRSFGEAEAYALDAEEVAQREGEAGLAAQALNNLGSICLATKRVREAGEYLETALNINRRRFGDRHPEVARNAMNLGRVELEKGDAGRAVALLRPALEVFVEILGPVHDSTINCTFQLGNALMRHGDLDEAELLVQRAVGVSRSTLDAASPRLASILMNLAVIQRKRGDREAMLNSLDEVIEIRAGALGSDHPLTADAIERRRNWSNEGTPQ
jgi:nephrocystin-3